MSIDERYNNLVNKLVRDINTSGLPICCIKDILQGLYTEAQQKYNYQIQQAAAKSPQPSADLPPEPAEVEATAAAQSAEPEAATAETAPTGKEEPHA